jgi:hypothetical protein
MSYVALLPWKYIDVPLGARIFPLRARAWWGPTDGGLGCSRGLIDGVGKSGYCI